jgi:glucose/arabinose dehydrogenase
LRVVRNALGITIALAAFALGACGEKDEPDLTGPPVVDGSDNQTGGIPTGDGRGAVTLEEVGKFESPIFLAQPEGDHALYVVEQTGRIMRVAGNGRSKVFLDLSREVKAGGEQGLLSVAFAPDYERSGKFYVDYTNRAGDTRVVEYRRDERDETEADRRSARIILRVPQPFSNHNGGLVLFGPDDDLYIGLGDGGSAGDPQRNGQNLGTLLGKILRIDPRPGGGAEYRIPADNPFADRAGARPEILAYGLRNPWRFSFDPETGDLWIGDVGQSGQEEIDVVRADDVLSGANFGWSAFEGTARFNEDQEAPNAVEPVLTYGRDLGCTVTGGYVVRDPGLPTLYGRYLYADFCVGQLRSFSAADAVPGPVDDDVALGVQVPSISSFAEDARGHVYAISLEGPVYRLVAG